MRLRYPTSSISLCPECEQALLCLGFVNWGKLAMDVYDERVSGYVHKRLDMEITFISRQIL